MKVLVADDDTAVLLAIELLLKHERIEVQSVSTPQGVVGALRAGEFDVLLLDLNYAKDTTSGGEGFSLLSEVRAQRPKLPIVVMTGWASIEGAVEAMRRGANDYLPKPWDNGRLVALLRRLDGVASRQQAPARGPTATWLSPAMKLVLATIERVAFSDVPVVITGEHGTGKEVVAKLIHEASGRRGQFVAVNAGALPDGTFESELFGHVRGAFTDAKADRPGAFIEANDGTLFLDEIASMPLLQQVKLLRVLQDREFRPVGATASRVSTARIVSATNSDVDDDVRQGRFRADLFYRINAIDISLPPLRERREEILPLALCFASSASLRCGFAVPELSERALDILFNHAWPGNIRQLEHAMQRAVLLAGGSGRLEDKHFSLPEAGPNVANDAGGTLRDIERAEILRAIERHPGDKSAAAKSLGLSRSAFYRRLALLDITSRP